MKITRVSVTYGELRSSGYPAFSNKRHETSLSAVLEEGETAQAVADSLRTAAIADVKRQFDGTKPDPNDPMQKPFERPRSDLTLN